MSAFRLANVFRGLFLVPSGVRGPGPAECVRPGAPREPRQDPGPRVRGEGLHSAHSLSQSLEWTEWTVSPSLDTLLLCPGHVFCAEGDDTWAWVVPPSLGRLWLVPTTVLPTGVHGYVRQESTLVTGSHHRT